MVYAPSIFDAIGLVFDLDVAHPGREKPYCKVTALRIFTARTTGLETNLERYDLGELFRSREGAGMVGGVVEEISSRTATGIALVAARTSADCFTEVVVPNARRSCS
jgi:hypothetical protein